MGVVISYDIPDKNSEMKANLKDLGYHDGWNEGPEGKKVRVNLPETTLWHPTKTVQEGLQDMKNVVSKLRVRLERAVALPDNPSAAIEGDPHSS